MSTQEPQATGDVGGNPVPSGSPPPATVDAPATNYVVTSQRQTIQVQASGDVRDVQEIGFKTVPSGVYAQVLVPVAQWQAGNTADYVRPVATAIEAIFSTQPVTSARFVQDIDPQTNLLASFEEFTVAYSKPGMDGSMTATVRVPLSELATVTPGTPSPEIAAAYSTLQQTAG